jgi:hypothetical protein
MVGMPAGRTFAVRIEGPALAKWLLVFCDEYHRLVASKLRTIREGSDAPH